jgi:uncharacterized protein YuzE
MRENKMVLQISEDDEDVGYLTLPGHRGKGKPGAVSRQIRLLDLLQYKGPDVYLDLDENGTLVGLEILA